MKARNKRKTKFIFLAILFAFFSIMTIFICFVVPTFSEKLSETNTVEFQATVVSVQKTQKNVYEINTVEYGKKHISVASEVIIDIDAIKSLETGQIVFFRVEKEWENLDEMSFIPAVVALKTQDKEIVTLEASNNLRKKIANNFKIIGSVFGMIFLLLSVHCFLLFKGINIFRKKANKINE